AEANPPGTKLGALIGPGAGEGVSPGSVGPPLTRGARRGGWRIFLGLIVLDAREPRGALPEPLATGRQCIRLLGGPSRVYEVQRRNLGRAKPGRLPGGIVAPWCDQPPGDDQGLQSHGIHPGFRLVFSSESLIARRDNCYPDAVAPERDGPSSSLGFAGICVDIGRISQRLD